MSPIVAIVQASIRHRQALYFLAEGKIINFNQTKTVDADVLSKVVMPNANGFYDGQGPDLLIYGARDKPQKKETPAKK